MVDAEPKVLKDLPIDERRYIAVVSEEQYEQRAAVVGSDDTTGSLWPVLGIVGSVIVPGGLLVRGGIALTSLIWAAASAETKSALAKETQGAKGTQPPKASSVIVLATAKQVANFTFLSGSAEVGQVYAANPVSSDAYYAVESYHDDILDHKLSELERILNSLGAKHYQISYEDADDSHLAAAVSGGKGLANAGVNGQITKARRRRFERSGTSDGREPELPLELVWFPREPAWRGLAESRLHHGRREFAFSVELENSLKLSLKTLGEIQKVLKVEAEGAYARSGSLTLSVKGAF